MKLNLQTFLIAGLTVVVIILIMKDCQRPSEEKEAERKAQFEMADAINKADKKEAQARQDSIGKVWVDSLSKINVAVKAKDRRIEVLTQQVVKLRTPRIDTLLIDNPDLASYVDTLTEIVQEQKEQIDTLKAALEFTSQLYTQAQSEEFIEDRIENNMVQGFERRVAELEMSNKKKGRGNRFWKGLATVLGVAVVVETAVLVVD